MSRSQTVSSDDVASSRMRIRGSLSRTRAIATPLLLAARELVAALADDRVEALGQLRDPVVDRGGAGRGLELRVGRVGPGEQQVLADRRVEQVRLLGHEPDEPAERRQLDLADVDPVDRDRALRRRRTGAGSGRSSSSCRRPTARRARRARRAAPRTRRPSSPKRRCGRLGVRHRRRAADRACRVEVVRRPPRRRGRAPRRRRRSARSASATGARAGSGG